MDRHEVQDCLNPEAMAAGCPVTSVNNNQSALRNIPEEQRFRPYPCQHVFFCRSYVCMNFVGNTNSTRWPLLPTIGLPSFGLIRGECE